MVSKRPALGGPAARVRRASISVAEKCYTPAIESSTKGDFRMRAIGRFLGLAFLLCMLPMLRAADVSGAWTGSFDFQGSSMPLTLNLKVQDAAVTGTVEGLPTTPAEIHDGKIDGDSLSFWLNSDYQGTTYKLVFKGKIAAGSIDFDFGTEDGSWGTTFTAKRAGAATEAPADITGFWTGSFEFNGNMVPVTFKLKSDGATVAGTVEGLGAAPIEIHDGKIDGSNVTFWLNVDYEGQTYALQYKGTIKREGIDFDFGTADGSWGATITVKKS
jgi:hypothetical protein